MIADLSDDYRPTKLGEKHGELYDNEWTDAFQIITTKLKKSDIIAIEMLLELLKVLSLERRYWFEIVLRSVYTLWTIAMFYRVCNY